MEKFAAGLLYTGLQAGDRILICGNNHSQLIIATLGAARAGMVFSLASPNFSQASQLGHLLKLGQFRALLMFGQSDKANQLLLAIAPEMQKGQRGNLKLKDLPNLTHVIYADEDHRHAATFTLSDIFTKSSKDGIGKLLDTDWDCHQLGAIQFTAGSTGEPKAVGLTHYQLINGCRIAAQAIDIKRETVLCCALPLFRIPVFALTIFAPFLIESRSVFPEPSPLPRLLFKSINKNQCATLLTNAAALRLLLKTSALTQGQKCSLPSIGTVILLGERVSADLLTAIEAVMPNAKGIAVGMLSTELGSIPILSDNTTNLVKAVGRVLNGYEHWKMERLMATSDMVRGVQVVQEKPGAPVIGVLVPKSFNTTTVADLKQEMIALCREQKLNPPDQIAIVQDFPRVNTRIQKYKLRDDLRARKLSLY
uniref:AMP-binding domain-containing protein n=1 Tax=Globodera pallida TaxID=36090 RepID=A0A183BUC6_GLOPA